MGVVVIYFCMIIVNNKLTRALIIMGEKFSVPYVFLIDGNSLFLPISEFKCPLIARYYSMCSC